MTDEPNKTTIQVFEKDAEEIKAMLPHLKNDAYRFSELVRNYRRKIVRITNLPGPKGSEGPLTVDMKVTE